jgi:hypothetical protein
MFRNRSCSDRSNHSNMETTVCMIAAESHFGSRLYSNATTTIDIQRDIRFALALACALCFFRIGLFDYQIFGLRAYPNHDSGAVAAAFASSMHALVTEGDLAWWLPGPNGGFAQYYNQFLSPVLPTAGSPIFVGWAILIKALSYIGVRIPEYFQFLVFQEFWSPLLAFMALALFVKRFVLSWVPVVIAVSSFALGGPGLWNNSWMFYQEWITIFLGLYLFDLLLERPTYSRLMAYLVMVVVTIASANYWTIFSQWLLAFIYGSYAIFFRNRIKRAFRVIIFGGSFWPARYRPYVVAVLAGIPVILWGLLLARVQIEQSGSLTRAGAPFSLNNVYERAQAADVLRYTTELFNPVLERAVENYSVVNEIHNATYIGLLLLPLIAIFLSLRWTRRDYLLVSVCAGVMAVRMTSGIFLMLFYVTPFMRYERHIFYFYQYFLELILILMAARGFDAILNRKIESTRVSLVLGCSAAAGAVILVGLFLGSEKWVSEKMALKSVGFAAVMLVTSAVLLWQLFTGNRRWALAGAILIAFLHIGDVSRYYWTGSAIDQKFSMEHWKRTLVGRTIEGADRLIKPWIVPAPSSRDGNLFENMPFFSELWPNNVFNPPQLRTDFNLLPDETRRSLQPSGVLEISSASQADRYPLPHNDKSAASAAITEWKYNELRLHVSSAVSGTAIVNQNYDPYWQVRIDGVQVPTRRVNETFLGFTIDTGEHSIVMEYLPLSRRLYWPIVWVTLLFCGALLASARWPHVVARRF